MQPTRRAFTAAAIGGILISRFATAQDARPIRLLVRGDDMGVARSVNDACIRCYCEGIVRSVEVIVPGPWFLDAAMLLKENPAIDVGVHLCLTSEWERIKWGPITRAPSLVDANGYFFPMTRQRRDFPANTGFVDANPKLEEVERELRAQIEMARRHIPRISHVSAHMGAASATPEIRALTGKLADEYKLLFEIPRGMKHIPGGMGGNKATGDKKELALLTVLEKLTPGDWMLVEHPAHDDEEMRAFGHKGYENVAEDRAAVTRAFTSEKVKALIQERKIELIGYR